MWVGRNVHKVFKTYSKDVHFLRALLSNNSLIPLFYRNVGMFSISKAQAAAIFRPFKEKVLHCRLYSCGMVSAVLYTMRRSSYLRGGCRFLLRVGLHATKSVLHCEETSGKTR